MKEQTSTSKILDSMDEGTKYSTPIFGSEASDVAMPRLKMNAQPVEPRITYEMIKEYLSIEGNATQNLTTFCQTYMEPMATKIMAETMEKNAIDKDEYPMTADLENRCVAMIGDLWHANPDEEPMGTSTVGSSRSSRLCPARTSRAGSMRATRWSCARRWAWRRTRASTSTPSSVRTW